MDKPDYSTSEYIVIYVYSLPDATSHRGHLKIGKTSIKTLDYDLAHDKEKVLESAVRKRIKEQTSTVDLKYILEYFTLGIKNDGSTFTDNAVHEVLKRSGFPNIVHTEDKKYGEWFDTSLSTVKNAIEAVKNFRQALDANEINEKDTFVHFREGSQTVAIEKTLKIIKKGKKHFLWDAKMRFGKTLAALGVAREMNYGKILIITHRPEVNEDWFNDFNQLFYGTNYKYGSRNRGNSIEELQSKYKKNENGEQVNPFVYFASIQYLRNEVDSSEKQAIRNEKWDMLIIDEADEGTQTALADEKISPIQRDFTLLLSGTPFNLLDDFNEDEIYSWTYTDEQELKEKWNELYPDEENPYFKMPKLSIFIYDLNRYLVKSDGDPIFQSIYDKAFNFKEFFRTDEEGNFKHEIYVKKFLDLISTKSDSNFPYSTQSFQNELRHTLWMVPGVKEARALEKLLLNHPVFRNFGIANIAGNGNEEVSEKRSRELVYKRITKDPSSSYSITLSCGKMTRGVSVPEWSAVFMLSNTTSASTYLQTIFRAQTPWEYQGRLKNQCFVFDFAPDRTLNVIAQAMRIKQQKPTTEEVKKETGKFLNFCPVISATDGEMKPFSTTKLLRAIKNIQIQRIVNNGFDDKRLYNLENLDHCTDEELEDFAELNRIIGKSNGKKIDENKIKMADNGFTNEEYEKVEKAEKKPKPELTEEEKELLKRKKEIAEKRRTRISILRGISIRMPMLIFGCKIDKNGNEIQAEDEITLKQFLENIDPESWDEFMPDGVTKDMFLEKFLKYYDDDNFIEAGTDIRLRAKAADQLPPSERVQEIAEIFSLFKNPDKETILTPWQVVNKHISDTLGGSNFNDMIEYNDQKDQNKETFGLPKWVDKGEPTKIWNEKNAKILEINSKSGLYPLLCAYNFYIKRLPEETEDKNTDDATWRYLWNKVLNENIYVVSKTPMAKSITERTLSGYTDEKTNVVYIKDLVEKFKDKQYDFASELKSGFKLEEDEMIKFDAVVGNPPYEYKTGQTATQTQGNSNWIYYYFQNIADKIGRYTSLIYPFGGWFDDPKAFQGFGKKILSDEHTVSITAYEGTSDKRAWYRTDKQPQPIFSNSVNLSAGVSIVFRDLKQKHETYKYFNRVYSDKTRSVNAKDWEFLTPSTEFAFAHKLTGPKLIKRLDKGTFGIESNFVELNPEKVSLNKADWDDPIILYTNDKSGSAGRAKMFWTDRSLITKNRDLINEYKLVTTSAYPKKTFVSGKPTIENVKKRLSELIEILPIGSAFGRSRMMLFHSQNKTECNNFLKYTQTNFFAYLVLQEPNRRSSFGFVIPDQDFTANSDIDWSKSIPEIDQQLYKKYNLSKEEIAFIEKMVKPMGE